MTVALIATMMPAMTFTAAAVTINDWGLLERAMSGEEQETVSGVFEVQEDTPSKGVRTIKLLADITATSSYNQALMVLSADSDGKDIVLDLNGHMLNRGLIENAKNTAKSTTGEVIGIDIEGNLTIIDSNPNASHMGYVVKDYMWFPGDKPAEVEGYVKEIKGGIITGGTGFNNGRGAGGICNYGNLRIEAGTICGNIALSQTGLGGGMVNFNDCTMTGGTICYNAAFGAGGLYNDSKSCLTISPAEGKSVQITNNYATLMGGMVQLGQLKLEGKVIIKGNYGEYKEYAQNLAIYTPVTITGPLTGSEIFLACADSDYDFHTTGVVTSQFSEKNSGVKLNDFIHYDGPSRYYMYLNATGENAGELEVKEVPSGYHAVSLSTASNGFVTPDKNIAAKDETVTLTVAPDKGYGLKPDTLTVEYDDGTKKSCELTQTSANTYTFTMPDYIVVVTPEFLPSWDMLAEAMAGRGKTVQGAFEVDDKTKSGTIKIKLLSDITAGAGAPLLVVPTEKKVELDLNGHSLDRGLNDKSEDTDGHVIKVLGDLTVTDSSDTKKGEVTGGHAQYGGGIAVLGKLTLEDASINGNSAVTNGGGVFVDKGATFVQNGGAVSFNTTENGNGGGVYVDGTYTMNSGVVGNNTSGKSGGGIWDNGTVTINNGLISDNNAAKSGGGIYVYAVDDSNHSISNHFVMKNGQIQLNKAGEKGGGIYADCYDIDVQLLGGEISLNNAKSIGGGVCANMSVTLGGDIKIINNTNSDASDNLFLRTVAKKDYAPLAIISGTTKLKSGASIGISTDATVSEETPVKVSGQTDIANKDYFSADNSANRVFFDKGVIYLNETSVKASDDEVVYEYNEAKKEVCEALVTKKDSKKVQKLVETAKKEIDKISNNSQMSVKNREAKVDSIVAKLKADIEKQKVDETLAAQVKALKGKVVKLKAYKNGKIKVKFKNLKIKAGAKVVRYQIYRATKKNFKKNLRKYTIKRTKNKKNYNWINTKKLKKGKKYYYKVRARVKLSDGTYAYTKWSNVKAIKCKKTRK